MSGASEFKTKINRLAIAEINKIREEQGILLHKGNVNFLAEAPYADIKTAEIIFALETYLMERHCEPDFELVLSE